MRLLLVTLTVLTVCLLIIHITTQLAAIPGQNWHWVGVPV